MVALALPSFALHRSASPSRPATASTASGNVSVTLDPVVYGPVDQGLPERLTRGTTYKVTFFVLLTAGQHSERLQVRLSGGELRKCEKRRLKPGEVNRVVCKFLAGRAHGSRESALTFTLTTRVKGVQYPTSYRHQF